MRWILLGLGVMLAAMATLLAMVVRAIEPGLALSLLAYAGAFVGMALVVAGAVQRFGGRR